MDEHRPEDGGDAHDAGRGTHDAGRGAHRAGAEQGGGRGPGADGRDGDPHEGRESAYELLQRGRLLLHERHHAQAAIVLERAERMEPGKGSIIEALGRAYYNSGQHDRARRAFEKLLEIDPSAHYAHYALGQSFKQLGRRREAYTHLRIAVALHPGSRLYEGALNRLGRLDAGST